MRAAAILFCFLPLLAQEQVPTKAPADKSVTASVAGLVVRTDTGEPIKKAKVTLWSEDGDHYESRSDADGRFQIGNVPPGRYGLWASCPGYLGATYGSKLMRRRVPVLLLEKGQQLSDLLIRMQRPAAITGRIVNDEGEPVQGANVIAQVYRGWGAKRRLSEGQSAETNDLGEYRIFALEPGKYYLRANPPRDSGAVWNAMSAPERPREREKEREREPSMLYPSLFYPAAIDVSQATRVELKPGDEMRADFTFTPVQAFSVRGHVLGVAAKSSDPVVVVLSSKIGRYQEQQQAARVNNDGSYEIPDVLPGTYRLSVSIAADAYNPGLQTTVRTIDVTNTDLENVDLAPPTATKADLRGRLTIEGDSPPSLNRINLYLMTVEREDDVKRYGGRAQVNADGTFVFQQVSPGTYYLAANPSFSSRRGYYLKSVRFGTRETADTGITITEGTPPRLEVVLSPAVAKIEGVVIDEKEAPVAGAAVLAVPRGSDFLRRNGFRVGSTDNRGGFVLANLRPGEYQLLAFDQSGDTDYSTLSDAEFLDQHENVSVRTQVQVGSTAKVKLKLAQLEEDREQDSQ